MLGLWDCRTIGLTSPRIVDVSSVHRLARSTTGQAFLSTAGRSLVHDDDVCLCVCIL